MSWQDVQRLRQAGRLEEAIQLGIELAQQGNGDRRIRTQIDWARYGIVKREVANINEKLKASKPIRDSDLESLMEPLMGYARQPRVLPDNPFSNMISKVAGIAEHVPNFPNVIRWMGMDGLSEEDWNYREFKQKLYPPIAHGVARGFAKWCKSHLEASTDTVQRAVQWLERVRQKAKGDDRLWLDWDRALMLRALGEHAAAAEALGGVLKVKQNEFWVWAEAGRAYRNDQPDLALACFCRALSCPSKEGFKVNVHVELAELLAGQGDHAQASREIAIAISVRERKGWNIPVALEMLIDQPWYDPEGAGSVEPLEFYAQHAPDALELCLDQVQTVPATYLGTIVTRSGNPPPGWKPRHLPRFAVRQADGRVVSLVAPSMRTRVTELVEGAPVFLVTGKQENGRDSVVQMTARDEGQPWDCTQLQKAIVLGRFGKGDALRVYVDRKNDFLRVPDDLATILGHTDPGVWLELRTALNPKNNRLDISVAEVCDAPDAHPDVREFAGALKRHPKGFGFADDVFIPPQLIDALAADVTSITGVAIYKKKPKSDDYGWAAVIIQEQAQTEP